MTETSPFPDHVVVSMRNLITYFVIRQQLVVLAMIELRPDLLKVWSNGQVMGIDLEPYYQTFISKGEAVVVYEGIWRNEWNYLLHGIGCKLTNIHSNEPLEWDAPNPKVFRSDWFWQHLSWRFEHEASDVNIEICTTWKRDTGNKLSPIISYLVNTKFIIETVDGNFAIVK